MVSPRKREISDLSDYPQETSSVVRDLYEQYKQEQKINHIQTMDRSARIIGVIQIWGWSRMMRKIFENTVILFST